MVLQWPPEVVVNNSQMLDGADLELVFGIVA
jgi:hypothetical protein